MIRLYKDPSGEQIFTKSTVGQLDNMNTASGKMSTYPNGYEDLDTLKKKVTKLESELEHMKVMI